MMVYRVLYLDHSAEMGGAEYSLAELVGQLKAQGLVQPVVATVTHGAFADHLRAMGIEVLPLDIPESARHFARESSGNLVALVRQAFLWRKTIDQLKRWVAQHPVDCIHSNTLKMHVLGTFFSKAVQLPLVWHMRDIPTHRGNARWILNSAMSVQNPAGIIAISKAVLESLDGLKGSRFTEVVYNGLDVGRLVHRHRESKAAIRQRLGLPVDARLAVSVGYFIPWKGQDVLIEAFSQLVRKYSNLHLVLIGKPIFQFKDEQKRLEKLAEKLGVQESVHFLGERHDILDILPGFDVFVCPSTQEPFGRVILEAMASRLPIVATQAGGIPEIVRSEKEALLVPPSEPVALARAMERLFTQPVLAEELVTAAHQRLLREFTLDKTAENVAKAYMTLLPAV